MSAIDDFPNKRYYSIGEVSEHFNVSKSLLRYWEKEFSFLKPYKNSKGDRRFTKENIQQITIIHNLVKEKGYTLKGAQNYLREYKKQAIQKQNVLSKLKEIKDQLIALEKKI